MKISKALLRIAVLGGNGFLGSDLVHFLSDNFEVTSVTRDNYQECIAEDFDVFINANGNSKRFWALQNVFQDFEASTISVYKTMLDFQFKKYVYISSVDVYPNHSSLSKTREDQVIRIVNQNAYGFHKHLSEQIVQKHVANWIILRSSMILGKKMNKGPFYDILNCNPIFVTLDSKLQLITTNAIAQIIMTLISKNTTCETFNLGGLGAFPLSRARKYFDNKIQISPKAQKQIYQMDVNKIAKLYPQLKTSEQYLQEFLKDYLNA